MAFKRKNLENLFGVRLLIIAYMELLKGLNDKLILCKRKIQGFEIETYLFCPNCKQPIKKEQMHCENCLQFLAGEHFAIIEFLKQNFQLIVIIGVLGTLTALLPSITTIYFGGIDKAPPNLQNVLIASLDLSSVLIIMIVFLLCLKTLENRSHELYLSHVLHLRIGDIERLLFGLFIIFPILVIPLYLIQIFPSMNILVNIGYLLTVAIVLYLLLIFVFRANITFRIIFTIYLLIFIIGLIAYILIISPIFFPMSPIPLGNIEPSNIYIESDVNYYSPQIPNSIGIGLSPSNVSGKNLSNITFHWSTNYGYFIDWQKSEQRTKLLGNSTDFDNNKIYWSFDINECKKEKRKIEIRLLIENVTNNSTLVNQTFNLTFFNNSTVKIQNF